MVSSQQSRLLRCTVHLGKNHASSEPSGKVPRAASSTAAALRSVSQLSVASRERSVAAVAGPAVVGVAALPWSEKVSMRHGDEDQ